MSPVRFDALLVSCEHATGRVPPEYAGAFPDESVLRTHRAWDPGAAVLARELQDAFNAPGFHGEFTRLLVDLNRGERSAALFSEFTPADAREGLLEFHGRWRASVHKAAAALAGRGPLLHLSIHSFTPVLDGETRNADVGLLYDPARPLELKAALAIREGLGALKVRRNYPYRGVSDGMTTWLRRRLAPTRYAGLEIELNQSFAGNPPPDWSDVRDRFISAVAHLVAERRQAS